MKLIDLNFDKDLVTQLAKKRGVDYFWLEDENRYYFTQNGIILEKNLLKSLSYFHQALIKFQKLISKDFEALKKILPESMAKIVFLKPGRMSDFQRYDILIDTTGKYKIIELNSETPAGLPEASCNDLFSNLENTNKNIFRFKNKEIFVVFSDDEGEDYINATFQATRFLRGKILNVESLELEDDGIFFQGVKIKNIYSFYPLEWIFADQGGEKFWNLYLKGCFQLQNGPINLITQSKKFWAYLWDNIEVFESIYQPEDKDFLAKNILPLSSFEKKDGFLPKPALEREGTNIGNENAENVVYQEYIEQKKYKINSFEGEKFGYITLGVYCNQKKAIGTYNRFCENKITDYTSYYLPAYFDEN